MLPDLLCGVSIAQRVCMYNKVMIIDRVVVITGSFNFTKAAEQNNAENLLVIRSKDLAKVYGENWERHKEHAGRYEGR